MQSTLTHDITRFEDDGGLIVEERRLRPAKVVELLTPRQQVEDHDTIR